MSASLEEQIACVKRELALRRRVYPAWVSQRRMRQETANREIAHLASVLETLETLQLAQNPGQERMIL